MLTYVWYDWLDSERQREKKNVGRLGDVVAGVRGKWQSKFKLIFACHVPENQRNQIYRPRILVCTLVSPDHTKKRSCLVFSSVALPPALVVR